MLPLAKRLRPQRQRAPVNYRIDNYNDDDTDTETDNSVDKDSDDEDKKLFEFFKLPQELRDMVYKEALVDPKGVHFEQRTVGFLNDILCRTYRETSPSETWTERVKQLSPNLMVTCKEVYHEARMVAYRQPFSFKDPFAVHSFLLYLTPSTINHLKDITIDRMRLRSVNNNPLLSGLRDAMNLTTFRFGDRVTGSNFQMVLHARWIGNEIANCFLKDASYFIRHFVAAHGIDALMQVVKFDDQDMRGDKWRDQPRPLSESKKEAILEAVKCRLIKLMKQRESLMRR